VYVRLTPLEWHDAPSVRLECYGQRIGSFLGLHGHKHADEFLQASSFLDDFHQAQQARLFDSSCWCPLIEAGSDDDCDFLQIEFNYVSQVNALLMQGHANVQGERAWVSQFFLETSLDGLAWSPYPSNSRVAVELTGNEDAETVCHIVLTSDQPIARFLRLWPTSWVQYPAIRLEILLQSCGAELGIRDAGRVKDNRLLATSCADSSRLASDARLGNELSSWAPAIETMGQYVQVDLNRTRLVKAVLTQGGLNVDEGWVSSFQLHYSTDGLRWQVACDSTEKSKPREFSANFDHSSIVGNAVEDVAARFVRIVPTSWVSHPSLRFELCVDDVPGSQTAKDIVDIALKAFTEYVGGLITDVRSSQSAVVTQQTRITAARTVVESTGHEHADLVTSSIGTIHADAEEAFHAARADVTDLAKILTAGRAGPPSGVVLQQVKQELDSVLLGINEDVSDAIQIGTELLVTVENVKAVLRTQFDEQKKHMSACKTKIKENQLDTSDVNRRLHTHYEKLKESLAELPPGDSQTFTVERTAHTLMNSVQVALKQRDHEMVQLQVLCKQLQATHIETLTSLAHTHEVG
jgi:hypothetical protein